VFTSLGIGPRNCPFGKAFGGAIPETVAVRKQLINGVVGGLLSLGLSGTLFFASSDTAHAAIVTKAAKAQAFSGKVHQSNPVDRKAT
jgi:hypothetical protein